MNGELSGDSVIDAQPEAAVDGIADRLRPQRAIEEEIGNPALADAVSDPAAIFEPALVSDRRRHRAVAGNSRDDAGMVCERLHKPAIDIGLDVVAKRMGPLGAKLTRLVWWVPRMQTFALKGLEAAFGSL